MDPSISNAPINTQKAYHDQYFIISTGETPSAFFEEERLMFWANNLLDFMLFTINIAGKIPVYINKQLYEQRGMDYLLNLAESYKQEIVKLKRLELYGVIK